MSGGIRQGEQAKCPYCGVPLTGMNSNPDDCLQKPSEPAPSEEVRKQAEHPPASSGWEWEAQILHQELDKLKIPTGDNEDRYSLWGRVEAALRAEHERVLEEVQGLVEHRRGHRTYAQWLLSRIRALAQKEAST